MLVQCKKRNSEITTLKIFFIFFCLFIGFSSVTHANTLTKAANNLGLIGYWSFNEGIGTIAIDFSGKGNHGTLTNDPVWTNGKLSKAIFFDGVNDLVTVNTSPSLEFTGNFSASVWVKTTGLNNTLQGNFIKTVSSFPTTGWALLDNGASGAEIIFRVSPAAAPGTCSSDGTACFARSLVNDGQWHNIVGVYDSGDKIRIYLDGVEQANANPGTFTNNATGLRIGQFQGSAGGGVEDEVRLYNRALSAAEVATLYNTSKVVTRKGVSNQGLVGWWPMEEGSGLEIGDFSGNKNNGTQSTATWTQGKLGGAKSFSAGSGNPITIPDSSSLNPTSQITISAWVNPISYPGNSRIVQKGNGDGEYRLTIEGGVLQFDFYNGGSLQPTTTSAPPVNEWTHVVGVYDGSNVKIYKNGVEASSAGATGSINTTVDNLVIGCKAACGVGGDEFNGKIDDVRIYNRGLSADEVAALYQMKQTFGAKTQTQVVSNGLVGYWPFGGNYINWGTNQVLDASGNANVGTLINMSTSTSPAHGKVGQAIRFNGSSYIIGTPSVPTGSSARSVSLWVNRNTNTDATLIAWGDASNSNYSAFDIISNQLYFAGFSNDVNSSTNLSTGQWYHVVYTYDANTTIKFYINGSLDSTLTLPNGPINTTSVNNFAIGKDVAQNTFPLNGILDEVRVYNRILSGEDILQLYRTGR